MEIALMPATTTNETLPRLANGDVSPYEQMHEEALFALILIVVLVQAYSTLIVVVDYRRVIFELAAREAKKAAKRANVQPAPGHSNAHVLVVDDAAAKTHPKPSNWSAAVQPTTLTISSPSSPPSCTAINVEEERRQKWEQRFHTAGTVLNFANRLLDLRRK